MGRSLPTIQLNRRQFVLGAAAVGIAACGPVNGNPDGGTTDPDAGTEPPDAGPPDAGPPVFCPGSSKAAIDTGKTPDQFVAGTPVYSGRALAYVIRDAGGLYAMSAVCTHMNCLVGEQSDGSFLCPCHHSKFSATGTNTRGPDSNTGQQLSPLVHYALCLSGAGTIAIDPSQTVDAATRLTA